jgi:hypothetical protein
MTKSAAPSKSTRRLHPWLVVLILSLVYLSIIFVANDADPLVFVTLGTQFTEADPDGTEGYDGQFGYFIAADPVTAPDLIDAPAYRYQRILLPAAARLLALGQASLVPWTMLIINLIALVGGTYCLEQLLITQGVSRWYALTYGLFAGVFMAVRLSLNEPLAYGLVLAAILSERRDKLWLTGLLLAAAALAKETTLLFTAGYGVWLFTQQRWRAMIGFGLIALVPFALWQGILYWQFGAFGVGSGGAMATPFELIPYNGVWRIYTDTGMLQVFIVFALLLLPSTVLPSLWAIWRGARDLLNRDWHPYVWLLIFNAGVMPFVPFSTYREPLGIVRFIVGMVVSVVLYGALRRNTRVLRYSTLWILLLALAINSG